MKILIIEDEAAIRTALVRRLDAEGYSADSAKNGEHGLRRALRNDYDLVLLDLTLPGLAGLEVLDALQHQRANLPVLVLSASSDVATKLRAYELGARDYLLKPFAIDELIAHVHAQLWHRDGPRQNILRAGSLVVDLAQRQARLGDRTIDLSNREFRVLQHLAEHAGDVVGREQLLAHVWGEPFPSSNVLEACIRRLRGKLGAEAPIRTVRHAGYRLEV